MKEKRLTPNATVASSTERASTVGDFLERWTTNTHASLDDADRTAFAEEIERARHLIAWPR